MSQLQNVRLRFSHSHIHNFFDDIPWPDIQILQSFKSNQFVDFLKSTTHFSKMKLFLFQQLFLRRKVHKCNTCVNKRLKGVVQQPPTIQPLYPSITSVSQLNLAIYIIMLHHFIVNSFHEIKQFSKKSLTFCLKLEDSSKIYK